MPARELRAHAFLMLTDVAAVWRNWGQPDARALHRLAPAAVRRLTFALLHGPQGRGRLESAADLLMGQAETLSSNFPCA